MAVLFAAQSLLHCLAVFGSALADCAKVSSPTNAAHAAAVKVGLITHSPGNIPLDACDFEAPRGAKLPRWPIAGRNEPDRQHGHVHSLFLPWGIITLTKQRQLLVLAAERTLCHGLKPAKPDLHRRKQS